MMDANKLYQKISDAIDLYSNSAYEYKLLDNTKKTVLSKLIMVQEGRSQTERESKALATKEYEDFCIGLAEAEKKYLKAKFDLQNMFTYVENLRTIEVSNRQAVK